MTAMPAIERHLGFNDCVVPGCTDPATIHHIVPVSKGGDNKVENLMPICSRHHNLLHGFGDKPNPKGIPVHIRQCSEDGCQENAYGKGKGAWRCRAHHKEFFIASLKLKYGDAYVEHRTQH
jgi:hypothetical protein